MSPLLLVLLGRMAPAVTTTLWILADGTWNDAGVWDDDASWNDGAFVSFTADSTTITADSTAFTADMT